MNSNRGRPARSAARNTPNFSTICIEDKITECQAVPSNIQTRGATNSIIDPVSGYISINDLDMASLNEGGRINDTVIDSYFRHIYTKVIPPEFRHLTHIFSSFFSVFLQVFDLELPNTNIERRVKKWVKNVDIFTKDFIFIPSNIKDHWFLITICFLPEVVKNAEEMKNPPVGGARNLRNRHPCYKEIKPCIIFFDSFVNWATQDEKSVISKSLTEVLKMWWKFQYHTEPCDFDSIPVLHPFCPQQINDTDCGIYVLQYAESFFQNPIPYFDNHPTPDLQNWFPTSIMDNKREQVRRILSEMRRNRPQVSQSYDSDVIIL